MKWFLEPWNITGGTPANANRSALSGVGIPQEELFIREVIQNSTDASDPKCLKPVKVNISINDIDKQNKEKLLALLHILQNKDHLKFLPVKPQEIVDFKTMLIEDYNTLGLTGTELAYLKEDKSDRFVKLCLNIGDTISSNKNHRGGSYGFGKSVYWANSHIYTVLIYSRFKPNERNNHSSRRFIGIGWYNASELGEKRYTGRAFLGLEREEHSLKQKYIAPFLDNDADNMAYQYGIPIRGEGEEGTSILILASRLNDVEKLREGVERYWWPRIIEKSLEVNLFYNNIQQQSPSPETNTTIKNHLRNWKIISNIIEGEENDERILQLTYNRKKLGLLSLSCISEDENELIFEDDNNIHNSIALIRYPKMVVEYYSPFQNHRIKHTGVFIADRSIDNILKDSEPTAHNRWDKNSIRISDDNNKKNIVKKTLDKIRSSLRSFLRAKQPPIKEIPKKCKSVGLKLGKLFRDLLPSANANIQDSGKEKEKRKIFFRYDSNPKQIQSNNNSCTLIEGIFTLLPNKEIVELDEKILVNVKPIIQAIKDENSPTGEKIEVNIYPVNDEYSRNHYLFEMDYKTEMRIRFESDPLPESDYNWQVQIQIEIESPEVS